MSLRDVVGVNLARNRASKDSSFPLGLTEALAFKDGSVDKDKLRTLQSAVHAPIDDESEMISAIVNVVMIHSRYKHPRLCR